MAAAVAVLRRLGPRPGMGLRLELRVDQTERGVRWASSSVTRTEAEQDPDIAENGVVTERFINHNPRNLERLALARKDKGWQTVWPRLNYWHRLRFRKTQRHVTAYVEAAGSGGKAVISASTQEWAIKKHLSSTRDVAAAENVGRVLAQRCLEAGISYLTFRAIPWEYRAESVQRFRSAMKDGGVILSEPRRVYR
ncbi:39S ribosomal protein L18, mitochondrial [Carcharodon carcharias]|uniref:39S ribosomal protein L18, mitochondrial n=1 Tax=Carcharodon carcharias TaxID=13397 RepID=UPI001B7DD3A3|nr:39S ribosomal protein L18, mitochondrial [Carcharodon carcharias]